MKYFEDLTEGDTVYVLYTSFIELKHGIEECVITKVDHISETVNFIKDKPHEVIPHNVPCNINILTLSNGNTVTLQLDETKKYNAKSKEILYIGEGVSNTISTNKTLIYKAFEKNINFNINNIKRDIESLNEKIKTLEHIKNTYKEYEG